jgi:hypothetical protein
MRVIKGLLLAVAITPLLGACVIYDSGGEDNVSVRVGSHTTTASSEPAEVLRAVRFEPGALIARVDSNGCTDTMAFSVEISEEEGPSPLTPARLTLTRLKPDDCKVAVPEGAELRWTYEQLGLKPGAEVTVTNPVRLP